MLRGQSRDVSAAVSTLTMGPLQEDMQTYLGVSVTGQGG